MRAIANAVRKACLALALLWAPPALAQSEKPNIVVILIDDAALMDLGVYGGEAATPNIDALAAQGAYFTQYRTSPLCSPTRAMLLTGMDNHLTGVATIPEVLPEEHVGQPGYSMHLEEGVLTLADHLRASGYRTLMTGKWHLGEEAAQMPHNHGFDRSFALAASGADNWEDKSYMPYYTDAPWYEDGEATGLPEDFYSSEFIVDQMIDYLGNTDQNQPFFAYLPFQAIHIPVQAPQEFIDKYKGRYDEGWHALREARFEKAQELGLIARGVPLAPMPDDARRWESLTEEDRAVYAARMEVNAAMMDAMDHHIGRFIEHLKENGEYENTVFVVTSDNGPEFNRGDNDGRLAFWMWLNGYHVDLEGLGQEGSWGFIGPEWANAAASPGALFKFYATEGGIRAPLIMAGPGISQMTVDSPAMVTDVAPTLLALADVDPLSNAEKSMTGRSLVPVLSGEQDSVYGEQDIRAIEVSGNSALYLGDYKIVRSVPPVGDGEWKLFNMVLDPGESQDLSDALPDVKAILLEAYNGYAEEMGVLEMPEGYNSLEQILENTLKRQKEKYGWLLIPFLIMLAGVLIGLWLIIRSIFRKRVKA